jgi:maleate cis-trans isomerase
MKCASVLDKITAESGVPALSSNKVLAWDLARSSGIPFSL